jgi:hypothetical protein
VARGDVRSLVLQNGGKKERMGVVLAAVLLAMHVQTTGRCPAAEDVERQLKPLLPPGFAGGSSPSDVAALEENADGSVTLSLARFDRGTIIHRHLPRASSCADQAESVAVALAVWEAEIHPEIALRLDHLVPAPAPANRAPAADVGPVLRRVRPPVRGGTAVLGLGAALLGGWQPGSFASGARIEGTLGRDASPWRLRLSAVAMGEHSVSLAPGQASWWRVYLAPGADYAIALAPRWKLVAGVAGVLGIARITGTGYSVDHRVVSTELGGEALARIEWHGDGPMRPWLGLAVVAWMRRQRLDVAGATTSAIPRAEPMVALGADFLWGR